MKKFKLWTTLCAVVAIAISCGVFGAFGSRNAYADGAAAVRIDFTDSALYTATGSVTAGKDGATLSPSSSVATKEKFTSFLLYIDVTADGAAIEVSFGANNTLKFTENAVETALEKSGGEREYDYGDFKDGGIISIEVMGSAVTVGVSARVAPEEFLYIPIAVYSAENALGEIKLSVSGGTANVRYLNVFSLAGTVDIEPDDYDVNDGKYPVKPAPAGASETPTLGGMPAWAIALIVVGCVAVAAGAAVGTVFIVRSKKRGKEKKHDEQ